MSTINTGGMVFINNFVKSVQDIMNSTMNVELVAENATVLMEKDYPSFVTGMMIMHGERDLILSLTFSKEAAADVVVSLLDVKYNKLEEEEVYDAIMEITNMVAGRLKTATIELGYNQQLTTPLIFVGPRHFMGAKARPTGINKQMTDKKFQMLASVYFL